MRLCFCVIFILSFCSNDAFALEKSAKAKIVTSIAPIASIVSFIGQDEIQTEFMIKSKGCPHHYHLKPKDLMIVRDADLVILINSKFEQFIDPEFLKTFEKEILYLSQIKNIKLLNKSNFTYIIDSKKEHNIDYHIWLDPHNAKLIAKAITKKLSEIQPKSRKIFNANLIKFTEKIDLLDKNIAMRLAYVKHKNNYIVSHDAFSYFEKYYNLYKMGVIFQNKYGLSGLSINELKKLIEEKNIYCVLNNGSASIKNVTDNLFKDKSYLILDIDGEFYQNPKSNLEDVYFLIMEEIASKFCQCIAID